MSDYWKDFIPAMRNKRLGDCVDSDPELAAAWLGWQVRDAEIEWLRKALQDSRLLWSMTCKCDCDGCKALDKRLINLAEQSPGSAIQEQI